MGHSVLWDKNGDFSYYIKEKSPSYLIAGINNPISFQL